MPMGLPRFRRLRFLAFHQYPNLLSAQLPAEPNTNNNLGDLCAFYV